MKLSKLARLSGQQAPEVPQLQLLSSGIINTSSHASFFVWMLQLKLSPSAYSAGN